jgi:hypothetical protein
MSEWQPIETAPKDGAEILVCELFGGSMISVPARWKDGRWRLVWVSWSDESDEIDPSYWTPLPEPPNGLVES